MGTKQHSAMTRTRILLVLDSVLFVSLLLSLEPRFEGLALHEWLGLAFAPLVVIHIVYAWRWIAMSFGRLRTAGAWRLRLNLALNTLLFIALVVTVFSGVMTSFVALPALGIAPGPAAGWRRLHNEWETYLEILVGLHIALNWNWIMGAVRRQFPARRAAPGDASADGFAQRRSRS
jgi:hypothetical protein